MKKQSTFILLAIFLGLLGVHRFYIRHYWRGVLYLLFSWTLIPSIFVIIDLIVFIQMSEEIFNEKYNKIGEEEGKIVDREDKKYTPLVSAPKKKQSFTEEYYTQLQDLNIRFKNLYQKMLVDPKISAEMAGNNTNSLMEENVLYCIFYDMGLVFTRFKGNQNIKKDLESFGFYYIIANLLPNRQVDFTTKDFAGVRKIYTDADYTEVLQSVLDISKGEKPIGISLNEEKTNEVKVVGQESVFTFPIYLKISGNDLFEEYATVLYRFAIIIAKADGVVLEEETQILKYIYQQLNDPDQSQKNIEQKITKPDEGETLENVLEELQDLIGLEAVKEEIKRLVNFVQMQNKRGELGLKTKSISYHIVFTGNPGTGKTTVARIVARLYKHLGILSEGHLLETDRSGLIAEYTGQTAVKTNKTIDKALNGILFIDEAYALVGENKDDFGKECVATLIKRMEDDRDKMVVIMAGYSDEMKRFMDTNPGFESRINRYIHFPDYSPEELLMIFQKKCEKLDYLLEDKAVLKLKSCLEKAFNTRTKNFGNARLVRNAFEKTIENQASRLARKSSVSALDLKLLKEEDIIV